MSRNVKQPRMINGTPNKDMNQVHSKEFCTKKYCTDKTLITKTIKRGIFFNLNRIWLYFTPNKKLNSPKNKTNTVRGRIDRLGLTCFKTGSKIAMTPMRKYTKANKQNISGLVINFFVNFFNLIYHVFWSECSC